MTDTHYKILLKYLPIWKHFKKNSTILNISHAQLKELEYVYIEIFNVRGVNLTCKDCIADMFKRLFNQFENYAKGISTGK